MTAYLRPALRQTRFFSRSGLTRHLGLLYRTVQPTIVLFLLVLALTGCLSEEIPTEKETTLVRVGEEALTSRSECSTTQRSPCPTCKATWCCLPSSPRGARPAGNKCSRCKPKSSIALLTGNFASFQSIEAKRKETVQEFCRELGIAFSVGLDPDMSIYSLYATRYVPRNFIISPNGKILLSETDYDATIQRLLIEQIEQALQTTE